MKTEMNVGGPVVIERTHSCQTEANLALVNHIANTPHGSTFDDLYPIFLTANGGLMPSAALASNLRSVLHYMVRAGYIVIDGRRNGARLYQLGDLSRLPSRTKAGATVKAVLKSRFQPAGPKAAAPKAAAPAGMPAPARQYEVLYGSVYVPGPSSAPRAGSLDFKVLPSHGNRC